MSRTKQAAEYLQGLRDDDSAIQSQVFRDVSRGWNDADWELWADCQEQAATGLPRIVWAPAPVVESTTDCPF